MRSVYANGLDIEVFEELLSMVEHGRHGRPQTGVTNNFLTMKIRNGPQIQCILANNFGASRNNLTNLIHVMGREAGMKTWVQILRGPAPQKFGREKILAQLRRLGTTLDCKYLRNGSTYRKSENQVINCNHSNAE